MDGEAEFGQMRGLPEMVGRLDTVGCARLDDRAGVIDQSRRDRGREGVGQIGFVVRGFIHQNQMVFSASASPLRMVDAPEVNMAAAGKPNLAQDPIDRRMGHRL